MKPTRWSNLLFKKTGHFILPLDNNDTCRRYYPRGPWARRAPQGARGPREDCRRAHDLGPDPRQDGFQKSALHVYWYTRSPPRERGDARGALGRTQVGGRAAVH